MNTTILWVALGIATVLRPPLFAANPDTDNFDSAGNRYFRDSAGNRYLELVKVGSVQIMKNGDIAESYIPSTGKNGEVVKTPSPVLYAKVTANGKKEAGLLVNGSLRIAVALGGETITINDYLGRETNLRFSCDRSKPGSPLEVGLIADSTTIGGKTVGVSLINGQIITMYNGDNITKLGRTIDVDGANLIDMGYVYYKGVLSCCSVGGKLVITNRFTNAQVKIDGKYFNISLVDQGESGGTNGIYRCAEVRELVGGRWKESSNNMLNDNGGGFEITKDGEAYKYRFTELDFNGFGPAVTKLTVEMKLKDGQKLANLKMRESSNRVGGKPADRSDLPGSSEYVINASQRIDADGVCYTDLENAGNDVFIRAVLSLDAVVSGEAKEIYLDSFGRGTIVKMAADVRVSVSRAGGGRMGE